LFENRGYPMVAVMPVASVRSSGDSFELALDDLQLGPGLRERTLDGDHVRVLAELRGSWPPILVWGSDNLVVDGLHRVAAARRLGWRTVMATRFLGSAEEAYIEAIRRNVTHGLPLSLGERATAARRVLDRYPEWSDRRISGICGLSAKTIARLRQEAAHSATAPRARVGRDGRTRPVHPAEVRTRIVDALIAQPQASLRSIAADVGASPETVRSVRKSMRAPAKEGGPEKLDRAPAPARPALPVPLRLVTTAAPVRWGEDVALTSTSPGQDFAAWFEAVSIGDEWREYLHAVPLSRVYEVADEASRRASSWSRFAQSLEGRVKGRGSIRA
jgi:transposase-like protein